MGNGRVKFVFLFAVLLFGYLKAHSQNVNQAKEYIENGECSDAIEMLVKLAASKPKDAEIPYQLGLAYLCSGDKVAARKAFADAKKNGSRDALYELAQLSLDRYELDEADQYIAEYRKLLKKAKKGTPDLSAGFDERRDRISEMLDRVERIVIVDSVEVDIDNFFKFYNLAKEAGKLSSAEILPSGQKSADPTVVFETADNRERLWAAENDYHEFELVSSSAMFGNNWTDPVFLGTHLGEGGDANYPFLLSDGITMYFANDGENSIGGYDIFITRRDGEDFLQPTNIGFPYNSPADDFLLAIDETKGIGWWASNRNSGSDSVTVYTFIPSEMRINYDISDPRLSALARIDSYKDSWDGKDYSAYTRGLSSGTNNTGHSEKIDFLINIPSKGVYKSFSDFKNSKASNMMRQYLIATQQLKDFEEELLQMRHNYKAVPSASLGNKIIQSENELDRKKSSLANMKNEIILIETGNL